MNTANNCQNWRRRLGLSQFKLSKLSQVSRNKISLAECGYGELSKQEVSKLKEALSQYERRGTKSVTTEKKESENV